MSALQMLRARPAVSGELARFVAVGTFNTVFGYTTYWAFLFVLRYRAAYSLSYAIGVFISYVLNCRFVFRRKPTWRGALRFPLVYVTQYALSLSLLSVLVERFHLDRRLAAAVVVCCSVPITFVLSRLIVRTGPAHDSPPQKQPG